MAQAASPVVPKPVENLDGTWMIADFTCARHLNDTEELALTKNSEVLDQFGIDRLYVQGTSFKQVGLKGKACPEGKHGYSQTKEAEGRILLCDEEGFENSGPVETYQGGQYAFFANESKESSSGLHGAIGKELNLAKAIARNQIVVLEFASSECQGGVAKRYLISLGVM